MPEIKRIFSERHQSCEIREILKFQKGKYRLGSISDPAVYSVDCIFEQKRGQRGSRCDEFVFFDVDHSSTGIYLIERKTNSQNVEQVRSQLDGGAGYIENFLNDDPATEGQPLKFMPIWVSKGLRNSVKRKLISINVSLRNQYRPIRHVHTNRTLPIIK